MATRRPAKIAQKKARKADKTCPVTGKPMTPVRMVQSDGRSGMVWMVIEDFDGSEKAEKLLIPT
jgi:hypothetical protein